MLSIHADYSDLGYFLPNDYMPMKLSKKEIGI